MVVKVWIPVEWWLNLVFNRTLTRYQSTPPLATELPFVDDSEGGSGQ